MSLPPCCPPRHPQKHQIAVGAKHLPDAWQVTPKRPQSSPQLRPDVRLRIMYRQGGRKTEASTEHTPNPSIRTPWTSWLEPSG